MIIISSQCAELLVRFRNALVFTGLSLAAAQAAVAPCQGGETQSGRDDPAQVVARFDAANSTLAVNGNLRSTDFKALWNDPAIRDFVGLSENSWDFTDPNAMGGFGPLPDAPAQTTR